MVSIYFHKNIKNRYAKINNDFIPFWGYFFINICVTESHYISIGLCRFFPCQFPPFKLPLSVILTAILFSDERNGLKNLQKCQVFVLGTFLVHRSYAAFRAWQINYLKINIKYAFHYG
jgi:hypothetical protein